jgi:hypothetical protein
MLMAKFYLLPPRPVLGDAFARFLREWLPGLPAFSDQSTSLTDAIQLVACQDPDVFLIFREDLPEGESPERSLADGYGAEPGDEVIELRLGGSGDVRARSWFLGAVSAA